MRLEDNSIDKYEEDRLHIEKFLTASLIEFDLPFRLVNILGGSGIRTLGDLVKMRGSVRNIRQLGTGYEAQIYAFLSRWGLLK